MDVVGGAILSAVLPPLFEKLGSAEMLNFAHKKHVDVELKKWESRLLEIHAVLSDAEDKQFTNRAVKIWLSKLRDLAYDVDDILDEFATEALESKLGAESQASIGTLRKLIPSCCTSVKPWAAMLNMEMESKLKEISARLQEIVSQRDALDLRVHVQGSLNQVNERLSTTSLVKEPTVYGRDQDKEAIIELLMSGESSDCQYSVISIIGMGGLGKTTLAQVVYSDERTKFDYKAWACVSDDFDISRITKTIINDGSCEGMDLNSLQLKLKQKLSGKKFLIVLDDVWSENYENWTTLCSPFTAGAPGSKIIVTTRNEGVSLQVGSVRAFALKELSDADCLSLFTQHALNSQNFNDHPALEETGKEIVQRCKGLPLAAKTLGGLLRGKPSRAEWEDILNSKIWHLPEEKSGILPALRLSYHHLPSHLKQCFAYCAIIPKDYEFEKNELVLLWMAEGLLQHPRGRMQTRTLGHQYFSELLSRSFFQQSTGNKSCYVMHDLISDLACSVSRETCFNLDDKVDNAESYFKVRHSSFTPRECDIWERFEVFYEMKNLRTFLALPSRNFGRKYLSRKVVHGLLPKLKRLRVLSLASYMITELPSSFSALRHLRYLDLSCTDIESLPESVCKLLNLETLILTDCWNLYKLPADIGNLIGLLCLDLTRTHKLKEMPPEIAKLTNLHTLSKFVVGKGNGLGIRELRKFHHLKGWLRITELQNVANVRDAELANLKENGDLNVLDYEWADKFHSSRNEGDELQVLNSLQPHPNIEELSIKSYGGVAFPSWVGDPIFSNMGKLKLENCRKVATIPPLGQLHSLRGLSIIGMDRVKEMGIEFFGSISPSAQIAFLSLETLCIARMSEWEQWSWPNGFNEEGTTVFPKLREFTICNCPKLVGKLPRCLPSVQCLSIYGCPNLSDFPEMLPSLCQLHFEHCPDVLLRNMTNLHSLTTLHLEGITGLVSLPETITRDLVALEDLNIKDCGELVYLWQGGTNLSKLPGLKRLKINRCGRLASLVKTDREEPLPCNLQILTLEFCQSLKKLPNALHSLSSLGDLSISNCPKLARFPAAGLPQSLRGLSILNCQSLKSLPEGIMHVRDGNGRNQRSDLKLSISGCPSLKCISTGEFPDSLHSLSTGRCTTRSFQSLHNGSRLHQLAKLEIRDSPGLNSFPDTGLPFPSLTDFALMSCSNLGSLPSRMQNLTSLQCLQIFSCRALASFPEGGLPPKLTSLCVQDCPNLAQPISEWGLHRLTSLKKLRICGSSPCTEMVVSFPDDDGLMLPTSLTHLEMEDLKSLTSISRGLHSLSSLQQLQIWRCRKLQFLPKEGLPATLGCLRIQSCPLLQKGCKREKGPYWSIIADIPSIII